MTAYLCWQYETKEVKMGLFKRKTKVLTPQQAEEIYTKDFFDMILPSTIKFFTDPNNVVVGDRKSVV